MKIKESDCGNHYMMEVKVYKLSGDEGYVWVRPANPEDNGGSVVWEGVLSPIPPKNSNFYVDVDDDSISVINRVRKALEPFGLQIKDISEGDCMEYEITKR